MKFVPGCSCCVGPCDWTITVKGCGGVGYPGVTVTVVDSGGGTVSGTTNGSGIVTFTGLATGTATATSTAPNARWVNTSVIKTLVAGANTSNLSMSSATGYICLGCLDPASTTLYYSAYRLFDHSGACNPETLSNPLTFSGTSDWSGEYLPAFAVPPFTDGQVRLVSAGSLTVYLEDLSGSTVTWSASATASVTCSPFTATATVNDPRTGCGSGDIVITITE